MKEKSKILIVEDDASLAEGLKRALVAENVETDSCATLKEAKLRLKKSTWDLVLLDVNLPEGSGLDLLAQIRKESVIPVILLTANDLETDIVNGLELGADDYITKPFSLAVLRARVNTQLRKQLHKKQQNNREVRVFQSGKYHFDFLRMEFSVQGKSVELSKTEQKLLFLLTENQGIIMSRSELLDRIWTGEAEFVDENALSVTVKRLRDKLGAQDSIKTIYGVGYTWVKEYE
ncbi:response regulator transcription factor [Clostridium sp. C105KSO13]|uniref:response regulator transcription factor n=1 Tax=Clostridium sp. C105KSO13 TaxID=1776045 RepID=UPI00074058F8|nr:response regulator transcription factor [Clostridium sp. C105KSO13]CUX31457.1 Sensory transduction protein regX3 [Clostridium sp. C105KSO13]